LTGECQLTFEHAEPLCERVPVGRWTVTGLRENLDHVKRGRGVATVEQQSDMVAAGDGIGSSVSDARWCQRLWRSGAH
jgi:hypothetical protein